ncbi:MAG: DUF3667 domain-containing protein [Parafilimonas sp.]
MSHLQERKEKICLNCNARIYGRYCHICGQENIESRETFWQLTTHLVYDIVHFDSRFFNTVKYLLFKPGYLTSEYLRGRRASYLHPIPMYVFTSAIFFVIVFAFKIHSDEMFKNSPVDNRNVITQADTLNHIINQLKDSANKTSDAKTKRKLLAKIDALYSAESITKGSVSFEKGTAQNSSDTASSLVFGNLPATKEEYDSIQKSLPAAKRDRWLARSINTKLIEIKYKFQSDEKAFIKEFSENFLHSLPTMMFFSLPFAAFILQLLYIRRKQFLYVQHGVFVIHIYIAVYIMILALWVLEALDNFSHLRIFNWLYNITILLIFFYGYKAMRNFYAQRRAKTVIKFFVFNFMNFIVLFFLLCVFALTSLIKI